MFNSVSLSKMKSLGLAASVSLIALSGAAVAEMTKVSEIKVETAFDAAQDDNAESFFPEIAEDIAAAIKAKVIPSDDMEDSRIEVGIRKLALDGDTILPDSKEFNQMEGIATITSLKGTPVELTFPVKVIAQPGELPVSDDYVAIAPSNSDFYEAMVAGFANVVVEKLEGINMNGG